MNRPTPTYYPQRIHSWPPHFSRGLAFLLAGMVAALVVSFSLPDAVYLLWLATCLVVGLTALYRGTPRTGIAIDSEGLTECYPLGWRRRLLWSMVTGFDVSPTSATLVAGRRRVTYDSSLCDWRALAERCRAALDPASEPAPEPEPVAPDRVAEWLAMAPGESFITRVSTRARAMLAVSIGLMLAALGWWGAIRGESPLGLMLLVFFLNLRPGLRRRSVSAVRADGDGLDFRVPSGWRQVAWADLLEVGETSEPTVVQTRQGEFWLPSDLPQRDRLLTALRRALEARARGERLPGRMTDVPEGALSLSRGQVPGEDRGLSVAEDAAPD